MGNNRMKLLRSDFCKLGECLNFKVFKALREFILLFLEFFDCSRHFDECFTFGLPEEVTAFHTHINK